MKTNDRLRLIAVKPNERCDSKYSKILKNDFYLFCSDYEVKDGELIKKKDKDLKQVEVPINFYGTDGDINISISAIIGKNGDGKSSIVELAIRILNNFACLTGFVEKQDSLCFIEGLSAELYYEIGGSLYSIIANGDVVTWKIPDHKEIVLDNKSTAVENKEKLGSIKIGEHFFYTQVSNYSLYAYNSKELEGESGSGDWITGIFHKNDGYQTPIVLHPMRTEGNINVNTENDLARQRLISLLMEGSFREINEKQTAKAFRIKLFEQTKLEQKTLLDFFNNYKKPYREDYFASTNSTLENTNSYLYEVYQISIPTSDYYGDNFDIHVARKSISLLKTVYNITKTQQNTFHKYLEISERLYPEITKIHFTVNSYIDSLKQIILKNDAYQDFFSEENLIDKIRDVNTFFKLSEKIIRTLNSDTIKAENHFDFTYLQRIVTVCLCEEIWLEKFKELKITTRGDVYDKIVQYIIYKTISIISKYPNYKELSVRIFTAIDFINEPEKIDELKNAIGEAIENIWKDVYGDKTHITLKIRQCLNFIQNHPYGDVEYKAEEYKYVDIDTLYNKVIGLGDDAKNNPYDYFFPAIFGVDILLQQGDDEWSENATRDELFVLYSGKGEKITLLSQLSSGERQQINTISSVIYHLRNINSVAQKDPVLVKYQHVNLIFEEIELYFHPEFQRTFLNFLVSHISKAKLDLKSVNLCFVTHSPFVLSDIPRQNILVLEKGKPKSITINTLGANIHEMLANDFMLDFTIGEVVRNKIDSFLTEYSKFKTDKNYKTDKNEFLTKNNIEFLVSNMGDGYLKSMLKGYYDEMMISTPDGLSKLIEERRKELKELEKKQTRRENKL